ncbi:helix-turn-helix domain-containing protein [Streptomyces sasae]|uniref:helix-turn-helix domain-containing protein n=1 Tax=Streptomyces sasae TaxID=1266772 RepID=UPI00292EEB47|nr:helix-turn-helix domain-containing protein [Streptomyces sasae]
MISAPGGTGIPVEGLIIQEGNNFPMTAPQFSAVASAHASPPGTPPLAGVIHIRHRHHEKFTIVGNHLAQNPNLSATAVGIGVYIQSVPDNVCVGIKTLAARFKEGETRIAGALRELEQAGYLVRRRERTSGGRLVTRTLWYELPCRVDLLKRPSTRPKPPAHTKRPRQERPAPPLSPDHRRAADLLSTLRAHDPRLLLSETDTARLAPRILEWLDRGVRPESLLRTLTGDLPGGTIRWPARLLAYHLHEWLPPAVPAAPPHSAATPAQALPLQNCDGCDRAFRAPEPGRCRACSA